MDGDFDECDTSYEESLALYRERGNERGIASLLQRLANSASQRREFDRSRALLRESQELAAGRFPYIEIANITVFGRIAVESGEVEAGADLLRQAADMAGDVDWHWWRASALASLAMIAVRRGKMDEAELNSLEALRLIREDENRTGTFLPLTVLARVALARGDRRRAGLLWGALESEAERAHLPIWERVRSDRAGPLLDETDRRFVRALDDGRELDLWGALAIALGEDEPPQTEP